MHYPVYNNTVIVKTTHLKGKVRIGYKRPILILFSLVLGYGKENWQWSGYRL